MPMRKKYDTWNFKKEEKEREYECDVSKQLEAITSNKNIVTLWNIKTGINEPSENILWTR